MVALDTPICDFGWNAPGFTLPGVDGKSYSLTDISDENGTLVIFMCNHCPYVKAIIGKLAADCVGLQAAGIGIAAISANDAASYPADSYENMQIFSSENNFSFPYLYDEQQTTAREYQGYRF